MSEKRRDSKGRLLKTGESQRADGRYLYKYVDKAGKTRYAYSWKLVPTDLVPKGKRDGKSPVSYTHLTLPTIYSV